MTYMDLGPFAHKMAYDEANSMYICGDCWDANEELVKPWVSLRDSEKDHYRRIATDWAREVLSDYFAWRKEMCEPLENDTDDYVVARLPPPAEVEKKVLMVTCRQCGLVHPDPKVI
jgi:hypothetical protein